MSVPVGQGGPRGWLVRRDERRVPAWFGEGVVTLAAVGLRGLPVGTSLKAFRYFMADVGAGLDHAAREELAHALFAFTVLVHPDDVVVTVDADAVHIGVVGHGDPVFAPGPAAELRRTVSWATGERLLLRTLPAPVRELLGAAGPIADITPAVPELLRLRYLRTALPDTGRGGPYVEAPDSYVPGDGDPPAVFLAGGISGVTRWHDDAAAVLAGCVVLNPHRARFPIDDPAAGWEQVSWEQHHLHLPGVITLFWFPASDPQVTTQPIAMFELGQALGEGRPVVVGADPGYPRAADVRMLCRLTRPDLTVHATLDAVLAETRQLAGETRRAGKAVPG